MALEKILLVGTQAAYNALTPDEGKLYFCSDTRNMYKGSALYTDAIRAAASKPATPAVGKLYVLEDSKTVEFYDGAQWVVVRPQIDDVVNSNSGANIVTAEAVYDFVMSQIEAVTGSGEILKSVAAGTADATIVATKADSTTYDVVVPGVVTTPTYDATTRKITLPVSGGEDVVIELGKDIFVDTTAENKYNAETGNIELHLNDGTLIEVPAAALVDVYTGGETTTAKVTISDTNVVTAEVKLAAEGNSLVVAADGGLLVDLSAYAKTADVEAAVKEVQDAVDALTLRVKANEDAIALLNGDAETAGSVAYAVAQAQTALSADIATAQAAAEAAQGAADAAQADADANAAAITELQDAFGFGTF